MWWIAWRFVDEQQKKEGGVGGTYVCCEGDGGRKSWQENRGSDVIHLVDPPFGEGSLFEPGVF